MTAVRAPLGAVIFDMDGLLIDSEPIHFESLRIQLANFGIPYGQALHDTLVGTTDEHVYEVIRAAHPALTATTEALVAERHDLFLELVDRPLEPLPGVREVLGAVADAGLPCAVASSSPDAHIERVLANMGIRDHFAATRSGCSVPRSKPYPDVYLATAADLSVGPATVLAFEDSSPGVRAARSAGMVVFAVPCTATLTHDLTPAHARVRSLADIDLAEIAASWSTFAT